MPEQADSKSTAFIEQYHAQKQSDAVLTKFITSCVLNRGNLHTSREAERKLTAQEMTNLEMTRYRRKQELMARNEIVNDKDVLGDFYKITMPEQVIARS